MSDLLERKATEAERQDNLDLADYLIRFDYRDFQQSEQSGHQQSETEQPQQAEVIETVQKLHPVEGIIFSQLEPPKPESWEQDITELENCFAGITLPTQPVKLNQCSTITNVSKFLESHFATGKAQNGKRTFLPYLSRLQELKQLLNRQSELK